MIKVLIVDDSKIAVRFLSDILSADPDINIIGSASSGNEAISMIAVERPDVVTMDINMPGIDGFETTRKIMETTPLPIIIVSAAFNKENVSLSLHATEAGALAIIEKPVFSDTNDFEKKKNDFISLVKLMSEIKVVSRKSIKPVIKYKSGCNDEIKINRDIDLIAVGASTGGPQALQLFLKELKDEVNLPILIVQHITSGFSVGFAQWLTDTCGLNVKIPVHGERINKNTVYVAPDAMHMGVDGAGSVLLSNDPPMKNLKPAVSYLFSSVAEKYGSRAIGVLLTGMGRDGADELKIMRDKGAVTFAQDEESSVVFGMPGEAVKIGGAVCILPPEGIAIKIKELLNGKYRGES